MKKFEWKASFAAHYKKADPNQVGRELESIEKTHGTILPKEVVACAKKRSSAMHCLFNWDNTSAAAKYREMQARNIIGAIRVIRVTIDRDSGKETARQVRVFIPPVPKSTIGYRSVKTITEREDQERIVENARRELRAWMKRYQEISHLFSELFDEVLR